MGVMISSCDSIPRRAAGEDRKDAALPAPNGKPSTSSPAGGRAEWQKCDRTNSIESPGYYKGANAGASVITRWTEKTTLKLR